MSARRKPLLGVESLEARDVPAGNVTVQVIGGDLVVTGDNASNGVLIRQIGNGVYSVAGSNITTVNGSLLPRTFSGVFDDIRVNMNGGNDIVDVRGAVFTNNFTVPTDLVINGGTGNDRIDIANAFVRDDVFVETGSGRDIVTTNFLVVNDDVTITKSAQVSGDFDRIKVQNTTVGNAGEGTLLIDLNSSGNDQVYLYSLLTDGINVRTRGGNDFVSMVFTQRDTNLPNDIDTGTGFDTVNLARNGTLSSPNSDINPPLSGVESITRNNVLPPII
jgi:hypothetical protein